MKQLRTLITELVAYAVTTVIVVGFLALTAVKVAGSDASLGWLGAVWTVTTFVIVYYVAVMWHMTRASLITYKQERRNA